MTDIFPKKKRSEIMSRVRGKNTKVELLVFRYLRSQGVYFQKHYARVAGKPDIAIPSKKKAVFIDGDFWHGRNYEQIKRKLTPYWREKIGKNITRDKRSRTKMKRNGWKVLCVWESTIMKSKEESLERINSFLTRRDHA